LMGDKNNRESVRFCLSHKAENDGRLLFGKCRRRLIQDQKTNPEIESPRNRDGLFLAAREFASGIVKKTHASDPQPIHFLYQNLVHLPSVDISGIAQLFPEERNVFIWFSPKEEIVRNAHGLNERSSLMLDLYAGVLRFSRRTKRDELTVEKYPPLKRFAGA